LGSRSEGEGAGGLGPRDPQDPIQQVGWRDRHRSGKPDQGVNPTDPFPVLKFADRRAMQSCPARQSVLGQGLASAHLSKIPAELVGDDQGFISPYIHRRASEG
jgi:hypothetical protein